MKLQMAHDKPEMSNFHLHLLVIFIVTPHNDGSTARINLDWPAKLPVSIKSMDWFIYVYVIRHY